MENKKKERIKKGLCAECGRPNDREFVNTCSRCARRRKVDNERLRLERIEQHKCTRCGKDTDGIHRTCEECRKKNRAIMKDTRDYIISQGLCVDCRKERAEDGKRFCLSCANKRNEMRKVYYAKHRQEIISKITNEDRRASYQECKAKGICTRCKHRKATLGHSTCLECRIKETRARRIRDAKKRDTVDYETCLEMNICTACRRNEATHGKVCDACYEKCMAKLKLARESWGDRKHYWVEDNALIFLPKSAQGTSNSPMQTIPH